MAGVVHSVGRWGVTVIALLLAACTYQGPDAEEGANPVRRSLTWFSYIGGDDIRAACRPGTPDYYRFVYNGIYQKQIRGYDLRATPAGTELVVRLRGESGDVSRFSFSSPFGPWDAVDLRKIVDSASAARIVAAFHDAVAEAPPSAGQQYASNRYYWVVAHCTAGKFALDTFGYPRVDLNKLAFADLLIEQDPGELPLRKAGPVEGMTRDLFYIRVNRAGDGLVR